MTTFVYWSFVLALIPFALDLIGRLFGAIGNWIAVHQDPFAAGASSTCLNLRWDGQGYRPINGPYPDGTAPRAHQSRSTRDAGTRCAGDTWSGF